MKKLYFIRHGLSEMNKSGHYAGRSDTPLSGEGREQAKLAGRTAHRYKIDCIVSSPLSRTLETAQIIASGINYPRDKIVTSELLLERDWGDLEGTPHREVDDLDAVPNIETSQEILKRAKEALDYLERLPAENILVVSHGTFGRALRHYLLEDQPFANEVSNDKLRLQNGEIIQWL